MDLKSGDKIEISNGFTSDIYLLVCVDAGVYKPIGIKSGNRWCSKTLKQDELDLCHLQKIFGKNRIISVNGVLLWKTYKMGDIIDVKNSDGSLTDRTFRLVLFMNYKPYKYSLMIANDCDMMGRIWCDKTFIQSDTQRELTKEEVQYLVGSFYLVD